MVEQAAIRAILRELMDLSNESGREVFRRNASTMTDGQMDGVDENLEYVYSCVRAIDELSELPELSDEDFATLQGILETVKQAIEKAGESSGLYSLFLKERNKLHKLFDISNTGN